jgi:hypothetical protein
MRIAVLLSSLLSLACGAVLAAQSTPTGTIKVLPSGSAGAAATNVAVNPQPLPPIHEGAPIRVAINPQPLPPIHGDDAVLAGGEPPIVVDITTGRRG